MTQNATSATAKAVPNRFMKSPSPEPRARREAAALFLCPDFQCRTFSRTTQWRSEMRASRVALTGLLSCQDGLSRAENRLPLPAPLLTGTAHLLLANRIIISFLRGKVNAGTKENASSDVRPNRLKHHRA